MSETVNALRAVEEEFKGLAIILLKDYIEDVMDVVLNSNKELLQDKMVSRTLFEMEQNGYIHLEIVNGEEKDYLTEKLIEVLAFAKAYNIYSNSNSKTKSFPSWLDFRSLCSVYCKDLIMKEEHITNPKFLEFYKKSLEEYHKKFARA